jgi:hypothetical protein
LPVAGLLASLGGRSTIQSTVLERRTALHAAHVLVLRSGLADVIADRVEFRMPKAELLGLPRQRANP